MYAKQNITHPHFQTTRQLFLKRQLDIAGKSWKGGTKLTFCKCLMMVAFSSPANELKESAFSKVNRESSWNVSSVYDPVEKLLPATGGKSGVERRPFAIFFSIHICLTSHFIFQLSCKWHKTLVATRVSNLVNSCKLLKS